AFNFPETIYPGNYYLALWADIWDDVVEANESDNLSPASAPIQIVNTLPDIEVVSWYATWDIFGDGALVYDVVNNGANSAPNGWLVALVLSPNDIIGDGDEIVLFAEQAAFSLDPGGSLFRDESAPASFSLLFDYLGSPVPPGDYYVALWVDPT